MRSRVDFLDPRLRETVAAAPADRQRRIALAIAEAALAALPEPVSLELTLGSLGARSRGDEIDDDARASVHSLAAELDARYLDLHDDEKPGGRSDGWELAFAIARGAAAAEAALDADPRRAALDAVYEASFLLEADDLLAVILEAR